MKKILFFTIAVLTVITVNAQQETEKKEHNQTLPSIEIKTMEGKSFNTMDIANDGKPIIISFWATWCKPCVKELTSISEVYQDWQEETGVKLVAVSIDDSRSCAKVQPLVNGKNWDYQVLLDQNGDFKRAMNVNMVPHTFILNSKREIVWQHATFSEGGELELIQVVRKIVNNQPLQD